MYFSYDGIGAKLRNALCEITRAIIQFLLKIALLISKSWSLFDSIALQICTCQG